MNTKLISAFLIAGFLAGAPALALAANPGQCRDRMTHKFIKCPPAPPKPTQCRDAKGKFTKCMTAPAPKPTRCRDAKGKFIKCK